MVDVIIGHNINYETNLLYLQLFSFEGFLCKMILDIQL